MRIAELSRHSGVPVTTIKFYIREGLLPVGERSHRNQAQYGEVHLQRLDLIRALREVAGLSIDVVRGVIAQLDKPWEEADPVGSALQVIYKVPERDRSAAEQNEFDELRAEISELIHGLDWVFEKLPVAVEQHHLYLDHLADAVMQMRKYIEPEWEVDRLNGLAEVAWLFSEKTFASFEDIVPRPGDDLADPSRTAILGTLLIEPIITALMRTALVMRSLHIQTDTTLPPTRPREEKE